MPAGIRTLSFVLVLLATGALLLAGDSPEAILAVIAGFVLLATIGALFARRRYVRHREQSRAELMRTAGMCVACGYFYRVKTDRCPECGTAIERAE